MIALIIFIVFTALYIVIGLKVKQWEVITLLGFPTETPENYIKNPRLYHIVRTICFVIPLLAVLISPYRHSGVVGIPILGLLWFFVNNRGINGGIKEYRRVMKETIEFYEANPSGNDDEFYKHAKRSLTITDDQIYEMYKENLLKR
jgi:hypothetical protein